MDLQEKDLVILGALKENAGLSLNALSKKTGIPPATLHYRLKMLYGEKIIKRQTIEIDYRKIGKQVEAFILIEVANAASGGRDIPKIVALLKGIPGVEHVSVVTGSIDMVLHVRASSIEELSELILKRVRLVPGVGRLNTLISLAQKEE
ncbi:MAG: Lrp/AsnC family transcriptional regulator [Candidatus Micrarchaeota archaeon]